jgi:hypothetical protein
MVKWFLSRHPCALYGARVFFEEFELIFPLTLDPTIGFLEEASMRVI